MTNGDILIQQNMNQKKIDERNSLKLPKEKKKAKENKKIDFGEKKYSIPQMTPSSKKNTTRNHQPISSQNPITKKKDTTSKNKKYNLKDLIFSPQPKNKAEKEKAKLNLTFNHFSKVSTPAHNHTKNIPQVRGSYNNQKIQGFKPQNVKSKIQTVSSPKTKLNPKQNTVKKNTKNPQQNSKNVEKNPNSNKRMSLRNNLQTNSNNNSKISSNMSQNQNKIRGSFPNNVTGFGNKGPVNSNRNFSNLVGQSPRNRTLFGGGDRMMGNPYFGLGFGPNNPGF